MRLVENAQMNACTPSATKVVVVTQCPTKFRVLLGVLSAFSTGLALCRGYEAYV